MFFFVIGISEMTAIKLSSVGTGFRENRQRNGLCTFYAKVSRIYAKHGGFFA